MSDENKPDEECFVTVTEHILIRDKDTKEVLVNQRDTLSQQRNLGNNDARYD
jgi:putative hemolysin